MDASGVRILGLDWKSYEDHQNADSPDPEKAINEPEERVEDQQTTSDNGQQAWPSDLTICTKEKVRQSGHEHKPYEKQGDLPDGPVPLVQC